MRILFDHQSFCRQKYGGIARYYTELIRHFLSSQDVEISLPFPLARTSYLLELEGLHFPRRFADIEIPGMAHAAWAIGCASVSAALPFSRFDVFHPTYYHPYFMPFLRKPFVLTVYDMIHERFSHLFADHRTSMYKRYLAERAAHIVAISQNTADDLCDMYGISSDKVSVVHLGSSLGGLSPERMNAPDRYLLFVGKREGYKNFGMFLSSAVSSMERDRDLQIVCVGGGAFTSVELKMLHEYRMENRVIQVDVSDSQLAFLYGNAIAFVFPSLYEGFGIPLLEAMNCGCPVIASNTSSLPEVAGEAALYFDPAREGDLEEKLVLVLENEDVSRRLIGLGHERSHKFSWSLCAEETLSIYRRIS